MILRTLAPIIAAVVLLGADTPAVNPLDPASVTQLGMTGILAVIVGLFVTGRIGPMTLVERAEARADRADTAAALATAAVAKLTDALAVLTREHTDERAEWDRQLEALRRDLSRAPIGRSGR